MRQEMTEGRARWPGGLVEIDRPLFEGDKERQPGQKLRHRRPRLNGLDRTVRRYDAARADDAGRRIGRIPAVDQPQRIHDVDTRSVPRRLAPAVSPFADTVGYSRAVRVGQQVYVSGTAPIGCDSPDAYDQAKRCLEIIVAALAELGAGPEHVVRTRMFVTDAGDWEAIGRAHGEVFGDVRPASAMLVISGLLDQAWKVEIEADAVIDD